MSSWILTAIQAKLDHNFRSKKKTVPKTQQDVIDIASAGLDIIAKLAATGVAVKSLLE